MPSVREGEAARAHRCGGTGGVVEPATTEEQGGAPPMARTLSRSSLPSPRRPEERGDRGENVIWAPPFLLILCVKLTCGSHGIYYFS